MGKYINDIETKKLGFGLMRLPRKEDGSIDIAQCETMTDLFLDAGMKYFDTAYVYEGSEEAAKKFLVERHPRDSYYLATKLNAGEWAVPDEASAKKELEVSLERTGAGYFDFYLLHALSKDNVSRYDAYGIWDFVKEAKQKGLIRHYGFSFHDQPELLEELLQKHPDVEFVQLQLNYGDWENPSVRSKANYEVCQKYHKPVVVMEPIKGGTLANPPEAVKKLFHQADPDASYASWAVRFAASLDNVMVVLSGMSSVDQMKDNLSYMKDFQPLTEAEQQTVKQARDIIMGLDQIPCTGCHYCTGGCPKQIQIPDVFSAMNRLTVYGERKQAEERYARAVQGHGDPAECLHCGQCENACPQHLPIISLLEKAVKTLGK
jgi:predicted aldo/keto reductase-like oxidoreductase